MTGLSIAGIAVGAFLVGVWFGRKTEREGMAYLIRVALSFLHDGQVGDAAYVLEQAIGEGE
jgi:hypothetical protein